MSYFDDASLVMIPSGYKTSKVYSVKPTDGSGDLTFSRSNDTATRVNSAGLIEKVRTNLILQSQAFNTTWGAVSLTVSANTTANPLNGAVDADTFTLTGATTQKFIAQAFALNGTYTASAYLKAGTHQFIQFMLGTDAAVFANFNISAGSVGTSSGCTASIISVGNGWYRCVMTFSSTTGDNVFILAADSASAARFSTTSSTGTFIAFGYQLETGDVATDYIATTSSAVSVGPVANVPRLDYLGSSCPRLLLEPQRTNLFTYSEQFDNAAWQKNNGSISANATTSPDGYTNADKYIPSTSSTDDHNTRQTLTVTNATAYTFSAYAKNAGYNFLTLVGANGSTVQVNLTTGAKTEYGSPTSTSVQSVGNGWYRISITATSTSTSYNATLNIQNSGASQYPIYAGNGTDGVFIWGVQVEAGAYATSYIPTLGAAVTRGADAASKTGVSGLLGATQGTIFMEVDFKYNNGSSSDTRMWNAWDSSNIKVLSLWARDNALRYQFYDAALSINVEGTIPATQSVHKVAMAYNGTNLKVYMDGALVTNTTMSASANWALTAFGSGIFWTNPTQTHITQLKQGLLFPTALTAEQLAELTTL